MLRLVRDGERLRAPDLRLRARAAPRYGRAPRSHLSEGSRPAGATSLSSCLSIANLGVQNQTAHASLGEVPVPSVRIRAQAARLDERVVKGARMR